MKTATTAERALRDKLAALAERGIDNERENAAAKLLALEDRCDFSEVKQRPVCFPDVNSLTRSQYTRELATFPPDQTDVGQFVKWAIEEGTKLNCIWKGNTLEINASRDSMRPLEKLAETIRGNFVSLWQSFSAAPGVETRDRSHFMRGLFDGIMDDEKKPGERLPSYTAAKVKTVKGKRKIALAPGLSIHPYTIALELGSKIRYCFPDSEIKQSLNDKIQQLAA